MNREDTTGRPRKPSLKDARYFLLAVMLEVVFVAGFFLLLPMFASYNTGCEACDFRQRLAWSAERGGRFGLTLIVMSLFYLWPIVLGLVALPPSIGLAFDYRRFLREERESARSLTRTREEC